MKISTINFGASALISGTTDQLAEIGENLEINNNNPIDQMVHEGALSENRIMLFGTEETVEAFSRYKENAGAFIRGCAEIMLKSQNLGKANKAGETKTLSERLIGLSNWYYEKFIGKYLELPKTVQKAEDVLPAIKSGLYDCVGLVFKNAK